MAAEPCELVSLKQALKTFAFPHGKTQASAHIKPLHWYVACRLVIEGGFRPEHVRPRPPFQVEQIAKKYVLHHSPDSATGSERTILGGLKTKDIDVTICVPGVGPVLAVSLKGTHNAFRNLTNRMEEAAGDCTNLHMAYPALVYGFWHVLRANEEADQDASAHFALNDEGRYEPADVAITAQNELSVSIERYAHALDRLSGREDLRDHPSRYETCSLTLVSVREPAVGLPHPLYPNAENPLHFGKFFRRLYALYDRRFVYQAPALAKATRRLEWRPDSPIIENTLTSDAFSDMIPRVANA